MKPLEVEEVITTGRLTVSVEDLTAPQTRLAQAMTSGTPASPGWPPALELSRPSGREKSRGLFANVLRNSLGLEEFNRSK